MEVQAQCFNTPFDEDLCNKEKKLMLQFIEVSTAEESFKKQKSRINGLSLGDHNTKFFHQRMACNKIRNKILSLISLTGVRLEDTDSIKTEILQYYIGLLGTPYEVNNDAIMDLGIVNI